jgi:hypothetical protein
MLAYVTWHAPTAGVDTLAYEQALEAFHRSLAHVRPSGFQGSTTFHIARLPAPGSEDGWAAAEGAAYEDWYLVDNWSSLGVLEEAAVSRGHLTRHQAVADHAAATIGGVYRLSEGRADLARARIAAWVAPARDHAPPTVADLLGDGMNPDGASLWRRSLVLGPAPEYCLLAAEAPAGLGPERLPPGWRAVVQERAALALA